MFALKLIQIGNSVGVILPKELLSLLHVAKGDTLYVTESPEGFRLASEFEQQMEEGRKIMKTHHDVLHELAK